MPHLNFKTYQHPSSDLKISTIFNHFGDPLSVTVNEWCCSVAEENQALLDYLQCILHKVYLDFSVEDKVYAESFIQDFFDVTVLSYSPYQAYITCPHHEYLIGSDYLIDFTSLLDEWFEDYEGHLLETV